MLRALFGTVGFGVAAFFWASAAPAKDIYFNCSTQISSGAVTTVYSSGIFRAPNSSYATRDFAQAFKELLSSQGLNAPYANCSTSDTTDKAFKWLDYSEEHALKMKARFKVVNWAPAGGQMIRRGDRVEPQKSGTQPTEAKPAVSKSTTATQPAPSAGKTRAEYEAGWQAKLQKYEAERKAWQAKIAAQKAEEERKRAAHAAAQEKARKVQQAYETKMTMFGRVLEEQKRRQREYEAALAQNNRCRDGDLQACTDIKAGRLTTAENKLAEAEKPKTSDDDARTCVTEPVVSASKTWKGAMQAVAFNGCKKPVDIRICLLRTGGWNCALQWGVKPQDRFTHSSFETQGEIFWDARVTGSNEALASPEG